MEIRTSVHEHCHVKTNQRDSSVTYHESFNHCFNHDSESFNHCFNHYNESFNHCFNHYNHSICSIKDITETDVSNFKEFVRRSVSIDSVSQPVQNVRTVDSTVSDTLSDIYCCHLCNSSDSTDKFSRCSDLISSSDLNQTVSSDALVSQYVSQIVSSKRLVNSSTVSDNRYENPSVRTYGVGSEADCQNCQSCVSLCADRVKRNENSVSHYRSNNFCKLFSMVDFAKAGVANISHSSIFRNVFIIMLFLHLVLCNIGSAYSAPNSQEKSHRKLLPYTNSSRLSASSQHMNSSANQIDEYLNPPSLHSAILNGSTVETSADHGADRKRNLKRTQTKLKPEERLRRKRLKLKERKERRQRRKQKKTKKPLGCVPVHQGLLWQRLHHNGLDSQASILSDNPTEVIIAQGANKNSRKTNSKSNPKNRSRSRRDLMGDLDDSDNKFSNLFKPNPRSEKNEHNLFSSHKQLSTDIFPHNEGYQTPNQSETAGRYMQDAVFSRTSWHCQMESRWLEMEPGTFPAFVQTGTCSSQSQCMLGLYECAEKRYNVKVLKRIPNLCNPVPVTGPVSGVNATRNNEVLTGWEEAWRFEDVSVVVACECSRPRQTGAYELTDRHSGNT